MGMLGKMIKKELGMNKILISMLLILTSMQAVVVADYRMDECYWLDNAGGVIDDVRDTNNSLHGTSYGTAQTYRGSILKTAPVCMASDYNLTGDHFSTPNNILLNTTNTFSISIWLNPVNFGAPYQIIAHKTTNYVDGFTLYTYVGYIVFLIGNGVNQAIVFNTVLLNQWTHIVATYDGALIKLYKNGALVASTPYTFGITNANAPLTVGEGVIASSYSYTGALDELKIYNHTLTPLEVTTIYNNELNGTNYDGTPRVCPTCGGTALAGIWNLIGIPADFRTAINKDVANVFDEFPAASYSNFNAIDGWVVFKRDYNITNNASSYSIVPYNGLPLEFGQGYWLASNADVNWSTNDANGALINALPNVDYNSTNIACVRAPCVEINLTPVNLNFGAPDYDPNDGSGRNRNNMLGFIGDKPVNWADCRILINGVSYTPSAAAVAGFADKQVWQYNPGVGGANANGYTTCDDTTPGGCKLEPYKGFWVILHGTTKGKTVKLLIPKE